MKNTVLVLDSGSSSIKFAVFAIEGHEGLTQVYRGRVEGIGAAPRFIAHDVSGKVLTDRSLGSAWGENFSHDHALAFLLEWPHENSGEYTVVAAGHRVVHGGERYAAPVQVSDEVLAALEQFVPLAPLHQANNLSLIRALGRVAPKLPQIACFDTAFHACELPVARAFALPREMSHAGIKRFGFHGLSYEYITQRLPDFLGTGADGRIVIAHLGNGASLCAVKNRKSVASTMGFTALEGLMMGTRSGNLDPGVLLYLMNEKGYDVSGLTDLLYRKSGLLGVSGISGDMRTLLASDHPHAREAIELFVYRINRELGSLAAALGGLDALVFTAGIGEKAAPVRAMVCRAATWLGLELDEEANARGGPRITCEGSTASAWVIPTDEERVIAQHVCHLLGLANT